MLRNSGTSLIPAGLCSAPIARSSL
ncbi:hypothetical protein LINPERHAP1_LOCUS16680 [Linum perenne]